MDIATLERKILKESALEFQFWVQCKQDKYVPSPEWHVKLFDVETDFSWPKLIVQIQGGIEDGQGRSRGAHVRKAGYKRDRDLSNRGQLCGWTVFEFTKEHLDSNEAIELFLRPFFNRGYYGTTDTRSR